MTPIRDETASLRVLVLMATAGGGHLAAARAVERELHREGHEAIVIDGLQTMSPRLRWLHVDLYGWILEHIPWFYDLIFRSTGCSRTVGLVRWLLGAFCGRRLLATIRETKPTLIISTFPTVTACLGQLKYSGKLDLPVIAIVTDYGVHPMWISPPIDNHLVVSHESRKQANALDGRALVTRFPVDPCFHVLPSRENARKLLGLPGNEFICLIMGGAWGVGNIEETAALAIAAGTVPVVVAGRNTRLQNRLAKRFPDPSQARVLGWTDQVPALMAAADCLVQNAGGVTCLEAIEVGLPIIFFRPLAGHGMGNAMTMQSVGAAVLTSSATTLEQTLRDAREKRISLPIPSRAEGSNLLDALRYQHPDVSRNAPSFTHRIRKRWPAVATILALLFWIALSLPIPLRAAPLTGHPIFRSVSETGDLAIFIQITDPETARSVMNWLPESPDPVTLFVDADASSGISTTTSTTLGITPTHRQRWIIRSWSDWRDQRKATTNLLRSTGTTPSYVLLDETSLRLGTLLGIPRNATIIIISSENRNSMNGFVTIDTSGMSPSEAISYIERELRSICRNAIACVDLSSYAALSESHGARHEH